MSVMWFSRTALLAVLTVSLLDAAGAFRLYLTDGTWHAVREYKREGDRVKYYSTERGDWEEIPASLVDFKKTESEQKQREDALKTEAAAIDAEDRFVREQREEAARIPLETGVFRVQGEKLEALKQAEMKIVNNKRRSILKAMSPIPIVAGKSTVEIDGLAAPVTYNEERPEFYIRLAAEERFGIAKIKPAKTSRIVQTWQIVPVTKEIFEETEMIEIFRRQVAEGLYKIWPTKPLEPGQYAVIEYTEGKGNVQVWDFAIEGTPVQPKPAEPEKKKEEKKSEKKKS
jgi:hypothetical protein